MERRRGVASHPTCTRSRRMCGMCVRSSSACTGARSDACKDSDCRPGCWRARYNNPAQGSSTSTTAPGEEEVGTSEGE